MIYAVSLLQRERAGRAGGAGGGGDGPDLHDIYLRIIII